MLFANYFSIKVQFNETTTYFLTRIISFCINVIYERKYNCEAFLIIFETVLNNGWE